MREISELVNYTEKDLKDAFGLITNFNQVFENKEQNELISKMELMFLKQPTSIIEYDLMKKDIANIQKKFNAYDKQFVEPVKKMLDLIKKNTALAYEKITTDRIKQLKKEKELEALSIGLLVKEVKTPIAEVRKVSNQQGLDLLKSLIDERKEDKELVEKLSMIYQLLTV